MVDDDLETGRPLVGDGEPGSVGQRLVFAHEPSALLVPFAHVQRERPVLMLLVHDRLLSKILEFDVLGEHDGGVVFVFDPPCRVVHPQHLSA